MKITEQERFWAFVIQTDEDCWDWSGGKDSDGYGRFSLSGPKKKTAYAHRYCYELHYGNIPSRMFVCHSCDNPSCSKPEHLWLGTASDNNRDRMRKGRGAKGEKCGRNKLTAEQVREIRRLYVPNKFGSPRLAKMFGVRKFTIEQIVNNKLWKHLLGDVEDGQL